MGGQRQRPGGLGCGTRSDDWGRGCPAGLSLCCPPACTQGPSVGHQKAGGWAVACPGPPHLCPGPPLAVAVSVWDHCPLL